MIPRAVLQLSEPAGPQIQNNWSNQSSNTTALEICDNSFDDDGDGLTDTDDINDCPISTELLGEENMTEETSGRAVTNGTDICDDIIDNDGDSFVDSDDPEGCILAPAEGAHG